MKHERIEVGFVGRVVATRGRTAKPSTFYIKGKTEVSIPSVRASETKVALRVIKERTQSGRVYESMLMERLLWQDRLYAKIESPLHFLTPDLVRRIAGDTEEFAKYLRPWLFDPAERLLFDPLQANWAFGDGQAGVMPLDIKTVHEDCRAATAERLCEIADTGLLFVGDVLYQQRPLPVWKSGLSGPNDSGHLFADDLKDGLRLGRAFSFPLDKLNEAVHFMEMIRGIKSPPVSPIDIEIAMPGVFSRSQEVIPNALAGIQCFFDVASNFLPDLGEAGMDACVRMAALRSRLESGDLTAARDVVDEFEAMSASGYYLPLRATGALKQWRQIALMTADAVLRSTDIPAMHPSPDEDEDLTGLRI